MRFDIFADLYSRKRIIIQIKLRKLLKIMGLILAEERINGSGKCSKKQKKSQGNDIFGNISIISNLDSRKLSASTSDGF